MRTRSVALSLNGATLALLALLLVTFVAFLGMTLFNTKGEPREALVAVSILNQGNWILPVSCGADIPYKPPMLAWCIAVFGWLNGGHVTEFLSRLPSALGAVVMLICFFRFYARRGSMAVAAVATLVAATTFELHRAATSCRVDMLLASFVVMAILAMYVTAKISRPLAAVVSRNIAHECRGAHQRSGGHAAPMRSAAGAGADERGAVMARVQLVCRQRNPCSSAPGGMVSAGLSAGWRLLS